MKNARTTLPSSAEMDRLIQNGRRERALAVRAAFTALFEREDAPKAANQTLRSGVPA